MARNATPLEAAHALVKELIAEKLRLLLPMTMTFIVSYIVLAGFAKDLMGVKIVGSVNLGFALIAFNYLLSWTLAIVCGRVAAGNFDPLAENIESKLEIRKTGHSDESGKRKIRRCPAARAGDLLRAFFHPSREPPGRHRRHHHSPGRAVGAADCPKRDRGGMRHPARLSLSPARSGH